MHSELARKRLNGRHHHLSACIRIDDTQDPTTTTVVTVARGNIIADCSLMTEEAKTKQMEHMYLMQRVFCFHFFFTGESRFIKFDD